MEIRLIFADFVFCLAVTYSLVANRSQKNLIDNVSVLKRIFLNKMQINESDTGGQIGKLF